MITISTNPNFEKMVNNIVDLTSIGKQSKKQLGCVERDEFKNSDLNKGYFCYNCIYWINTEEGHCRIVDDRMPDLFENISNKIIPYGVCNGYPSNVKQMGY